MDWFINPPATNSHVSHEVLSLLTGENIRRFLDLVNPLSIAEVLTLRIEEQIYDCAMCRIHRSTGISCLDLTMCWLRQVCNIYTQCGHKIPLADDQILCESDRCIFSPAHPIWCRPPACKDRCAQYRKYPEQYSPHLDRLCPACQALKSAACSRSSSEAGPSSSRGRTTR